MSRDLVASSEVARILGVTRQRVFELAATAAEFPSFEVDLSGARVWFRKMIDEWAAAHEVRGRRREKLKLPAPGLWAIQVGMVAREAGTVAREVNHSWIGIEHLLLALLRPGCPGAAPQVLTSFGLTYDAVRDAYVEAIKRSFPDTDGPESSMKFTAAAQLVLERANFTAEDLRDEEVRSEHVLLALADAWEGGRGSPELLHRGVQPSDVRARCIQLTEAMEPPGSRPPDS